MECTATIVSGPPEDPVTETFALTPLEACRLIATRAGFFDLDLEPDDGVLRLTVTGRGQKVTVRGRTVGELAEKLKVRVG
jgi:hypothetical protein